ncbi:hypothetical protein Nhal_0800 [Nitrosococcus halophilus Nc 4]|uniref:Uncharacterized protein n=1 Tax=Nitrosococcus halophilus (strain Nc4) TaxID=472759 RepID=D5BXM1_NITHN|nr:hypothetical protein [Nitrosococcus halophilus]ADE13979.1 hypothetical protein Nhal_0800 [Nitrosococcus halophilus Nc 4]
MMAHFMAKFRHAEEFMRMPLHLEECREQLEEVLEEWILFRVHKNLDLPVIDGIELIIKEIV